VRSLADRLVELVDGELDAVDAAAVRRHLARCPACRATTAGLRALAACVRRAGGRVRAPRALRSRVEAALALAGGRSGRSRSRR
jgi:anti-sigma factor (TIGR02949 family)